MVCDRWVLTYGLSQHSKEAQQCDCWGLWSRDSQRHIKSKRELFSLRSLYSCYQSWLGSSLFLEFHYKEVNLNRLNIIECYLISCWRVCWCFLLWYCFSCFCDSCNMFHSFPLYVIFISYLEALYYNKYNELDKS